MKTVVALFEDRDEARKALKELRREGFPDEHISLIVRHEGGKKKNIDGVSAGGEIGGILGGVGGLLLGLGLLTIPGLGPVLAAGPLVTTLAGVGAGAVAGSLLGGLIDLGIPEENAREYEEGVRRGGLLIAVLAAEAHAQEALDILNRHQPVDLEQRSETWYQTLGLAEAETSHVVEAVPVTGEPAVAPAVTPAEKVVETPAETPPTTKAGTARIYSEAKSDNDGDAAEKKDKPISNWL